MRTDPSSRYGGALLVGLIAGLVLGFAAGLLVGLLLALLAAVAWLVVDLAARRRAVQRQREPPGGSVASATGRRPRPSFTG